ncbi:hypothetical protein NRA08_17550 [Acinetobacter baumannii]|nr:hypothetical protein [Acinetobacter baumannii]
MDNYKIKVKDEAESKEAQELFFELGAKRPDGTTNLYHSPSVFGLLVVEGLLNYVFADVVFRDSGAKELTLPQLRDLVAQSQLKDQGLISGADLLSANEAFEAWQNGFDVEFIYNNEATLIDADTPLDVFKTSHGFRLKPQTIKLELEIPKPFEPKEGEIFWFVSSSRSIGYDFTEHEAAKIDSTFSQFGAWHTEEEVKQVVAQLRKLGGNNS